MSAYDHTKAPPPDVSEPLTVEPFFGSAFVALDELGAVHKHQLEVLWRILDKAGIAFPPETTALAADDSEGLFRVAQTKMANEVGRAVMVSDLLTLLEKRLFG
jgi:hypothetical protein